MKPYIQRQAADLAAYSNLVVILGMRVYSLRGLTTLLRLGSEVGKAVNANPDGLLFHESFYFSLLPLHVGLRQSWRDFETLENWTRALPHDKWMKSYDGMREPVGLLQFAQAKPALGGMLTARGRLKRSAKPAQ